MGQRRSRWRVLLAAPVLWCGSACTGSDRASEPDLVFNDHEYSELVGEHPEIQAAPDLDLTYILVGSFGPEELALRQQTAILRSRCLQAVGFDVPTDQPTLGDVTWDGFSIFPKLNEQFVASSGYGIVSGTRPTSAKATPSALDGYVATLSDAQRERFGQADAICLSQIEDELFDDFDRWETLRGQLEQLRNDFIVGLQASKPIAALDTEWSDCMTNAGYSFKNPTGVLEGLYERFNRGDLDLSSEISIASADFACRTSVGYEERYWRLYQTAEVQLIERNYELIQEVRQAKYGRILNQAPPSTPATSDT